MNYMLGKYKKIKILRTGLPIEANITDRIAIQLVFCRGHMQESGQHVLGCSIEVGWLGLEHPIQTGTTHVPQALASQGCRLMPIPEFWHGGRTVKAVWFVAQD